jgi:predicted HicB family RNase H-like nuclease
MKILHRIEKSDIMKFEGYKAHVVNNDSIQVFHGEVFNLKDMITFEGTCVDELQQAFVDSVEDYLDLCRERDEKPEKPFSGKFILRINPDLHQRIVSKSKQEGKSLNTWVENQLEKAVR